jgi:hypothetical protein
MDLDPGDFLDVAPPSIPDPLLAMNGPQTHTPVSDNEHQMHTQPNGYIEQSKSPPNPLGWCYPNYFGAPPQFEESQYYDRPSLGQMISKPLHKIGNRLSIARNNARSPHMSQSQPELNADFALQNPVAAMSMRNLHQHIQPAPPPPQQQQTQHHSIAHSQPQHYRNTAHVHDQLHMFTTPN